MLQNRITTLEWTIRLSVILGIPFWIAICFWMCNDSEDIGTKIIISLVCGVISIGYLCIRYMLELQACEAYLQALQNRDFKSALTLGRSYYGYRRSGLKGAAGTYLTVYDETAINNDITAYSNE